MNKNTTYLINIFKTICLGKNDTTSCINIMNKLILLLILVHIFLNPCEDE